MLYSHYLCTSHWVETSKHHCHLMTGRTLRHQKKKSRKTSLQNRQFLTSSSMSYLLLLPQLWNNNKAMIVLTIFVRPKSDHCLPLTVTVTLTNSCCWDLETGPGRKYFLSGITQILSTYDMTYKQLVWWDHSTLGSVVTLF